jgi:hypothetical protein
MAKRLACMVISGAANADCLNILQPALLHQGTLIEVVIPLFPGHPELTSCIIVIIMTP